jgi:hypothetical protein
MACRHFIFIFESALRDSAKAIFSGSGFSSFGGYEGEFCFPYSFRFRLVRCGFDRVDFFFKDFLEFLGLIGL